MKALVYVVARMGCRECSGLMDVLAVTTDEEAALAVYRAENVSDMVDEIEHPRDGVNHDPDDDQWPLSVVHGDAGSDWAVAVFQVDADLPSLAEPLGDLEADAVRALWLAARLQPKHEIRIPDDAVKDWSPAAVLRTWRDDQRDEVVIRAENPPGPRFLDRGGDDGAAVAVDAEER